MPALALANIPAPAMLPMPSMGAAPSLGTGAGFGQGIGNMYGNPYANRFANPMQIPGGYPYFGSPFGRYGSPYAGGYGAPYGGYQGAPYGYGSPYANMYGGGGAFGGFMSLLPFFANLFGGGNSFGGSFGNSDFNVGGCIGCMHGSMYYGGIAPLQYQPQSVIGGDRFASTEAGFMPAPAVMPRVSNTGGDRFARVDSTVRSGGGAPAVAGPATRPGVGERAPAILPPASGHEAAAERSPIWPAFIRAFNACAPGCQPAHYAAFGEREDEHGNPKPSCHRQSLAIDLGAMVCGSQVHQAIDRGRFEEMVQCMRGKMGTVLYRNGAGRTSGHRDHAHFSNGCVDMGRRMG